MGLKRHSIYLLLALMPCLSALADVPFNISGKASTKASILIVDLKADTIVYNWNKDDLLIPASVMKSVTSASAMKTRGIDDCFTTSVVIDGKVKNGVVDGNLVIKVTGDPTIESVHFKSNNGICDSIVANLKKKGITRVNGKLIVETSDFIDQEIPRGWLTEDVVWPYGTGHYGANYHDNTFTLNLPSKSTQPEVPDLKYDHRPSNAAISIKRQRGSSTLTLNGKMPRKNYSVKLAMPRPEVVMLREIENAIDENGITISNTNTKRDHSKEIVIYNHRSPQFGKILRSLMVRSDNMMAEGMLRAVAPGGTRQNAIDTEIELWSEAGLPTDNIVIEDGSGLSRNDRLSATFLANMYKYMWKSPDGKTYAALFPVAGKDGTMRNFLKGTSLEGQLAMKTGSMRGVQCYGGYKLDNDGNPTHAVVILVNNFTCDRAKLRSEISKLLLDIFKSE